MAKLMGQDEQDEEEDDAQDIQRATSRAFSRPDLSASRTSSREGWGTGRWPSIAFSTRRGISAKEMWRGRERATAPPSAAEGTAGMVPPSRPASRASLRQGNRS